MYTSADKLLALPQIQAQITTWRSQQARIVFTNGCFDLLHPGHIDYLEKARQLGDKLIVGLNSDASVQRLKGMSRPLCPEKDRARMLAALASVDAVVMFEEDTPLALITALQPDVLVKGGDYEGKLVVGREVVEKNGGEVVLIPFLEGYSTTSLIERIQGVEVEVNGQRIRLSQDAIELAIPLHFNGPQPNTYGVPAASAHPYEDGEFVGDVNRGGSCNFEQYTFVPHCNGTHTECVGHVADQPVYLHEQLTDSFSLAQLISIQPIHPSESPDSYQPPLASEDWVIDKKSLEKALAGHISPDTKALIIRTLPNGPHKLSQDYMQAPPPFFSNEAMTYIHELGIHHLLVDMPSVDRLFDEGKLSNHRIFWQLTPEGHQVDLHQPLTALRTITEMIYAPDEVADGTYMLELQAAPFMADAAPSRPRLFKLA